MKKRQWSIIAAAGVLVLAYLVYSFIKEPPPKEQANRKASARGVEVLEVTNGPVTLYTRVNGSLKARQKIALFAEVSGLLQAGPKPFESGIRYQKGETLLSLNRSEAKAAYEASRSTYINTVARLLPDVKLDYPQAFTQWKDYLDQITSQNSVPAPAQPQNDTLRLFLTAQGLYRDYQNLASARERLQKFTITAPFTGVLTEAQVETGTLVRPGQPLGEFSAVGAYELEATVPRSALAYITVGDSVLLQNPDGPESYTGQVARINAKVNSSSLRVSVFINLQGENLQDGQFLTGRIKTETLPKAFALPRKLVVEQNKIYSLSKDTLLQKTDLEVLHKSTQEVVVGNLPNGLQIPKKPVPGAYTGMPVKIIEPR
jgi:multidrug efflux pump subunit AcrA (membrane-fusion protein)